MGKLELVQKFKMEQENEHLQAYKRMFPQARPNIFQMELIEGFVDDAKAWQKTLEFWAGNDYRPQSVQKMLDYYRQVLAGTIQTFESKEKVSMRVGANESQTATYACNECFDTGERSVPDPTVPFVGARWEQCKCRKAA